MKKTILCLAAFWSASIQSDTIVKTGTTIVKTGTTIVGARFPTREFQSSREFINQNSATQFQTQDGFLN